MLAKGGPLCGFRFERERPTKEVPSGAGEIGWNWCKRRREAFGGDK